MKTQPSSTVPSRWVKFSGPLTTVMTIAIIETMAATGLRIPNPPAFLILSIVFSAFTSGFTPGLISAIIAWLYLPYFFSIPGQLFHYSDADLLRVIVWAFTMPVTALMVGVLKHRSERIVAMEQSVASLQEQITERRRAEEMLRGSELKFRSIFDNSVDAIGVSKAGIHVMVNPAYLKMFGYDTADQLVGKSILDLIVPSERAHILDYVRRRARGEEPPSIYETCGLRRDNTEFDMEAHVSTYELGGELYTVPILRDVTQRKQAEEALRESEIRYRAIVEGTTDLICRFLPDTTLTFVNEAYCRYFNQSRDQLIGTRFLTFIPEGERESIQAHVNMVIQNKEPVTYAHEVITPTGELRWQEWTDSTILNDDGQVVELQSIGRDITEPRMVEKTLQESEQRFREMLQGVDLAGVILDRQGRVAFINDFLLQLAGWTREEAPGRNWFDDFLPPEVRENVRAMFHQMTAEKPISPRFENEIITRAGQRRLVHWSNTMLFDLNGQVIGTASIGDDITERTRAEREREALISELEAKNAELEQFTYTVSHDLKSPLVTIKGFLGFLKEDIAAGDTARFHADIERIGSAAEKMEQLLKELLELSRIGRKMNPPQEVRFEELAREAMELVHGQLEARAATIRIQPDLPLVYGDHQRLVEVLQNLIDNAAKFAGNQAHPQIEIGQHGEEGGKPIFYVKDNGIGIAPKHHEQIFGLFNKLDPNIEGTGVGLALVKRIVELHGGRIWVESESGRGSTFYFTLLAG